MDASDELLIKQWLKSIGESDPAIVDAVIDLCRNSDDALVYYRERARRDQTD